MIGGALCEKKLDEILMETANEKYGRSVRRYWNNVTTQLAKLRDCASRDPDFWDNMLQILYRHHRLALQGSMQQRLPKPVHTHLFCCVAGRFRAEQELVKETKRRKRKGISQ